MRDTHWRGGVWASRSSIMSAATNDGMRNMTSIFYGTKPMCNSSIISMKAWNADYCSPRRCHHPTFLRNEANKRSGSDFNSGIEFDTLGRIGADHGESSLHSSVLPRVIRRGSVSGSGFLRNEPNRGLIG